MIGQVLSSPSFSNLYCLSDDFKCVASKLDVQVGARLRLLDLSIYLILDLNEERTTVLLSLSLSLTHTHTHTPKTVQINFSCVGARACHKVLDRLRNWHVKCK